MGEVDRRVGVAAVLLAVGFLGILGAPLSMLLQEPDLTTSTGRHLLAGALGITALVLVEVLVCLFPLRRGERWALLVVAVPLLVLGLPVLLVDAAFVPARTRLATLAPQILGDAFAVGVLVYLALHQRRRAR